MAVVFDNLREGDVLRLGYGPVVDIKWKGVRGRVYQLNKERRSFDLDHTGFHPDAPCGNTGSWMEIHYANWLELDCDENLTAVQAAAWAYVRRELSNA